jgi:hypothetical protein
MIHKIESQDKTYRFNLAFVEFVQEGELRDGKILMFVYTTGRETPRTLTVTPQQRDEFISAWTAAVHPTPATNR